MNCFDEVELFNKKLLVFLCEHGFLFLKLLFLYIFLLFVSIVFGFLLLFSFFLVVLVMFQYKCIMIMVIFLSVRRVEIPHIDDCVFLTISLTDRLILRFLQC